MVCISCQHDLKYSTQRLAFGVKWLANSTVRPPYQHQSRRISTTRIDHNAVGYSIMINPVSVVEATNQTTEITVKNSPLISLSTQINESLNGNTSMAKRVHPTKANQSPIRNHWQ